MKLVAIRSELSCLAHQSTYIGHLIGHGHLHRLRHIQSRTHFRVIARVSQEGVVQQYLVVERVYNDVQVLDNNKIVQIRVAIVSRDQK